MQLTSTTDYAIRIVCYLAAQRQMISTSELSQELSVPSSYIPKITKKLKQAGIIKACEGTNGGYMLAKQPENISLMEIISCVEETMAINRCLEEDRFCSRNLEDTCKIHKILLSLQNTYNNKLESVKVSDVIRPGEDEYFGRFYVVLKLNLKEKSYECVYSHIREVYEKVRKTESYEEFKKIASEIKGPVLFNNVEGGRSPFLSRQELEEAGVKMTIYPNAQTRVVAKKCMELLNTLQQTGTTAGMENEMLSHRELWSMFNSEKWVAIEKKYMPD